MPLGQESLPQRWLCSLWHRRQARWGLTEVEARGEAWVDMPEPPPWWTERPRCLGSWDSTSRVRGLTCAWSSQAMSQVSAHIYLQGVERWGGHAIAGQGDQQATQCLWEGASHVSPCKTLTSELHFAGCEGRRWICSPALQCGACAWPGRDLPPLTSGQDEGLLKLTSLALVLHFGFSVISEGLFLPPLLPACLLQTFTDPAPCQACTEGLGVNKGQACPSRDQGQGQWEVAQL